MKAHRVSPKKRKISAVKKGKKKRQLPQKTRRRKPTPPAQVVDASTIADPTNAARQRKWRRNLKNILILPPTRGKEYEECKFNLVQFCLTYLPNRFPLKMSPSQLEGLKRIQQSALTGGLYATACPRGDGKTERAIASIIWCALYGHKKFIVVVAADADSAKRIIEEVWHEIADNNLIYKDWPQVSELFRHGIETPNSCRHLMANGESPRFACAINKVVLPTVKGIPDASAGVVIISRGLTGSLRGLRHKGTDGIVVRPDYMIVDDAETDESAHSPKQVETRERLLTGAILGLGGPDKPISAVVNCTVIASGSMAHRLLDHDLHPEWDGLAYKMLVTFANNEKLWDDYANLRHQDQLSATATATDFYLQHRKEMDEGCEVSWEARKKPDEISAIQSAYNLLIDRGKEVFWTEYQNEPPAYVSTQYELDERRILTNLSGYERLTAPSGVEFIACGVDVNFSGLNWTLLGAKRDSTTYVLDHGKVPDKGDLIPKDRSSGQTEVQLVSQAIASLVQRMDSTTVMVDGEARRVGLMVVDCGYMMDTVFAALKAIKSTMNLIAVRGRDAKNYKLQKHNLIRTGNNWQLVRWQQGPVIVCNSDYWKEQVQKGFLLLPGVPGSISLYGRDMAPHLRFSAEIVGEILREKVVTQMCEYYRWERNVGHRNDLLDSTAYAYAAIHASGASSQSVEAYKPAPRQVEQVEVNPATVQRMPLPPRPNLPRRRPRLPVEEW